MSSPEPYPHGPSPATSSVNVPAGQWSGTSDGSLASLRPSPFASPAEPRPASSFSSSASAHADGRSQRYFHSRRVRKGEVDKPWTKQVDGREKWVTILPVMGILVGMAMSAFLVWDGLRSVVKHRYCPVLTEDWSGGLDRSVWMQEVQMGGFGWVPDTRFSLAAADRIRNGEFEMTTPGDDNVFVQDGRLVIRAGPQDERLMEKDSVVDLGRQGVCTSKLTANCYGETNTTVGNGTVLPPALSGRINTRPGASIRYGRVEVTARMPAGDWLWPAIWMLPVNDTYGLWPASGEIDVAESRGNNYTHPDGGNDFVSSALHWGPNPANDAYWRTHGRRRTLHQTWADGFHVYGLEWSQRYLFTYVDSRLLQVMYVNLDGPLWRRGAFPQADANGSRLHNVWAGGSDSTPFDRRFYLVLNLAVGGTNGWFADGLHGKPWVDASPTAPKDFWDARHQWLPTWTRPQMEVSRVLMWQQCDGDEEL